MSPFRVLSLLERKVAYVDEPLWRIRLDGDVVLVTAAQRDDLRRRRGETGYAAPELEDDDSVDDETEAEELSPEDDEESEEDEPVSTGKKKPTRILPPEENAPNPMPIGSVVLRAGAGRKQTGSYYTNRVFVEYLVRRAIDPLAQGKRPEKILRLKVCDPAMGFGHFLVGAPTGRAPSCGLPDARGGRTPTRGRRWERAQYKRPVGDRGRPSRGFSRLAD